MTKNVLVRLITGVAILAIAVTACGQSSSTAHQKVVGGTVTVRLDGDWTATLDPQLPSSATTKNVYSGELFSAFYDTLVAYKNGKFVPYIASSWKQTRDSITFTIRKDAKCNDGTPLTATTVVESLQRLVRMDGPELEAKFGPGPYSVSGNEAASTVTFKGSDYGDMMYGFLNNDTGIICHASTATSAQLTTSPSGSGPYTIQSAVHGDTMTLRARQDWKWGPNGLTSTSPGFPQTLVFKVIANDTTAANLLLTGGLDLADVHGADVQRLRGEKALQHHEIPSLVVTPMYMNHLPGRPTADEQVRRALMTAIDPKAWSLAAYGAGSGEVGTSFVTPGMPCYDPGTAKVVPKPSVQNARSILLADGYTMGAGGKLEKDGKALSIDVMGSWPDQNPAGVEYLAAQFNQVGIDAKLENLPFPDWSSRLGKAQWDVTVFSSLSINNPAIAPTTQYFHGALGPQGGRNRSTIMDPGLDAAIASAQSTVGSGRCEAWAQVQRLVLQKHHILPLAAPIVHYFGRGIDFDLNTSPPAAYSIRRAAG